MQVLPKLPLMRLAADLLFVLPRHHILKLAGNSAPLCSIEFDSLAQAKAAYESDEYQQARAILGNVRRDVRIVEGV